MNNEAARKWGNGRYRWRYHAAVFTVALACGSNIESAAAASVPSPVACIGKELVGDISRLLIHAPFDSKVVNSVQRAAAPAHEVLQQGEGAQNQISEIEEAGSKSRTHQFKIDLGKFAGLPYQDCYRSRLNRARGFVKAIDTSTPRTVELYPTLADWADGELPCRAHRVLSDGIDSVSKWLDSVAKNISTLTDLRDRLKLLSEGLYTGGGALLEAGHRLQELGLGGIANISQAYQLTGLYLSEDLARDAGDIEGIARRKILAAHRVQKDLEIELVNLRQAEEATRTQLGAGKCDGTAAKSGESPSTARDRLRRLRERQSDRTSERWRDANKSLDTSGNRLRQRTEQAVADYQQDAARISKEMLRMALQSTSQTFKEISRKNAHLYRAGHTANCAESRRKIAAFDQWLEAARQSQSDFGGGQHRPVIDSVQQNRAAEMAAAKQMGCL